MEVFVRSIPNEYSYKHDYLDNNIENIQILSMGASIGRSGIDPECFALNSFNAGLVSQGLEEDCAIIRKYLNKADSLKVIILPILPYAYSARMVDGIESWRLRKYPIYMDIDDIKPNIMESLEITDFSSCIYQIRIFLHGINTVECYKNGMGNDTEVGTEEVKNSEGLKFANIHNSFRNVESIPIIVNDLKTTIKQCQERNVRVCIVVMPTYYTYRDNVLPEIIHECDSISTVLEKTFSNVIYLNMFSDNSFKTEDFRDSDHLSQAGAKKLTLKLSDILEK